MTDEPALLELPPFGSWDSAKEFAALVLRENPEWTIADATPEILRVLDTRRRAQMARQRMARAEMEAEGATYWGVEDYPPVE